MGTLTFTLIQTLINILPSNNYALHLILLDMLTFWLTHIISTLSSSNLIYRITRSTLLTGHYAIDCDINITKLWLTRRLTTYRSYNKIDYDTFSRYNTFHYITLHDITTQIIYTSLKHLIDKHAPTKTKYFSIHTNSHWFNSIVSKLKHNFRKYDRNYTLNPTPYNLSQLVTARTNYRKALKYNKVNYIKYIIETNSKDYKKLYNTKNKWLGWIKHTILPDLPTDVLFNNFENYFIDKIHKIYDKFTIKKTKLTNLTKKKYMTTNDVLSTFDFMTITEIYNLIVKAENSSPNDPLPWTITKSNASILAQLINHWLTEQYLTY